MRITPKSCSMRTSVLCVCACTYMRISHALFDCLCMGFEDWFQWIPQNFMFVICTNNQSKPSEHSGSSWDSRLSEQKIRLNVYFFMRAKPASRNQRVSDATDPQWVEWLWNRRISHSFLRSLFRSYRSFIWLLRTTRFARALRHAHSFARSLTHSLRSSWERGFCL